ncbi:uncharacterized protein LOC142217867 [Leptodactylus fuscus]|uniref:uncharacterized protein LOC142217867 n=1 Tax=Leptodactylus fuscus TaxID=238119 RepID=UPI003F4EC458
MDVTGMIYMCDPCSPQTQCAWATKRTESPYKNKNFSPVIRDQITATAFRDLAISQSSCPQSTEAPSVSHPCKSILKITDEYEDSVCLSPLDIDNFLTPILSPAFHTSSLSEEESLQSCVIKAKTTDLEGSQSESPDIISLECGRKLEKPWPCKASLISEREEFLENNDPAVNPECKNEPGDIPPKLEGPVSNEFCKRAMEKSPTENSAGSKQGDDIAKTPPIKKVQQSSWAMFSKTLNPTPVPIKSSIDCFQQFRKAALAKEERERALKAQEVKRQQEDRGDWIREPKAMDTSNFTSFETKSPQVQPPKTQEPSKDVHTPEVISLEGQTEEERNLARKKEQERRRRETMTRTIDMYLQSDIMADFEENLC